MFKKIKYRISYVRKTKRMSIDQLNNELRFLDGSVKHIRDGYRSNQIDNSIWMEKHSRLQWEKTVVLNEIARREKHLKV